MNQDTRYDETTLANVFPPTTVKSCEKCSVNEQILPFSHDLPIQTRAYKTMTSPYLLSDYVNPIHLLSTCTIGGHNAAPVSYW